MKRQLLNFAGTLLVFCFPAQMAAVESVVPKTTSFGPVENVDNSWLKPLESLYVGFDRPVDILPSASAVILCGGDTVVKATRFDDPVNYGENEGFVAFYFDGRLLPKGREYSFVVAPGSVASREDADVVNGLVEVPFYVPATLGKAFWNIDEGGCLSHGDSMTVYWHHETKPAYESEAFLYREGIEVGRFPVAVAWDWSLGQARMDFGRDIRFEKGVEFSVEFPEGIASALYRDDIVNEEASLTFVGDCAEIVGKGPEYRRVTVREDGRGVPEGVDFIFDIPFVLGGSPKVTVLESDGSVAAQTVPYVNTMINCFCLSAEFSGLGLESGKDYVFVVEGGSVVSAEGDPLANPRQTADYVVAGVGSIDAEGHHISPERCFDISGCPVSSPADGVIHIRNGRKFMQRR